MGKGEFLMADYKKDSLGEEASALGQRVKGAAKDAYGDLTDNERLEREGERENALGNARQEANDVIGSGSGAAASRARAGAGRTVHGLFNDRESAESAYRTLTERGYTHDDVNVLMSDETRKRHFADDDKSEVAEAGSKALEGLGVGSAVGGTLGAIIAAVAAIGTNVLIPGVGLVVAGPVAAALAGAGAGGATGGLIGALVGSGIPEEHAKTYDEGIRNGRIYMGVNARGDEDAEYFEREWRDRHRGESIYR
jgi:uncharacterized protein YjbJ (UPF0337 family)